MALHKGFRYDHWSYDRIYRTDMIKQPDVLMFLDLYNTSFSKETKRVNYDFYEPRTIHESSLSPAIHSILAAELDKMDEAVRFFGYATRLDLDNYNRNTREGLHITSIAMAWANRVRLCGAAQRRRAAAFRTVFAAALETAQLLGNVSRPYHRPLHGHGKNQFPPDKRRAAHGADLWQGDAAEAGGTTGAASVKQNSTMQGMVSPLAKTPRPTGIAGRYESS